MQKIKPTYEPIHSEPIPLDRLQIIQRNWPDLTDSQQAMISAKVNEFTVANGRKVKATQQREMI